MYRSGLYLLRGYVPQISCTSMYYVLQLRNLEAMTLCATSRGQEMLCNLAWPNLLNNLIKYVTTSWPRGVVQSHGLETLCNPTVKKKRCATSWPRDVVQPRGRETLCNHVGKDTWRNPMAERRYATPRARDVVQARGRGLYATSYPRDVGNLGWTRDRVQPRVAEGRCTT